MIKIAKIKKIKDKYRVVSRKGKNLGEYETREDAVKRLQQVEYFKHKSADKLNNLIKKSSLIDSSICNLLRLAKSSLEGSEIENELSYSYIMRKLRSDFEDKVDVFLKEYKKCFDEGYIQGTEDFEEAALLQAINKCELTKEDLLK